MRMVIYYLFIIMVIYFPVYDVINFRINLQPRAKYIGNLQGFTENLEWKRKFNFAFWLFFFLFFCGGVGVRITGLPRKGEGISLTPDT